jgi:O-acetyl-ADP-ribose deacetylase (regulator of RNase III)
VAFPSIGTGAYGYPVEDAAAVALRAVIDYLRGQIPPVVELVRFVLYGQQAYQAYEQALARLVSPGSASERKEETN